MQDWFRFHSPSSTDLIQPHIHCSVRLLTTKPTSKYHSFVIGCILVSPVASCQHVSSDLDSAVTSEVTARSTWQAQNKNLSLKPFSLVALIIFYKHSCFNTQTHVRTFVFNTLNTLNLVFTITFTLLSVVMRTTFTTFQHDTFTDLCVLGLLQLWSKVEFKVQMRSRSSNVSTWHKVKQPLLPFIVV